MAALCELIQEYIDAEKYNEFRNKLGRDIMAIKNDEVRGNALSIFQPNFTDSDSNKIRLIFLAYHLNNEKHIQITIPLKDEKSIDNLAVAALSFSKEVRYHLFPNESRLELEPKGLSAVLGATFYLQTMVNVVQGAPHVACAIANVAVAAAISASASGITKAVESYNGFFAAPPEPKSSEANQRALVPG